MTQFSEDINRTVSRCGSCDEKIRSMSPNNSAPKRGFLMRSSGTFVLVLCDDPAVKEAEQLAMHQYAKEHGYACSFMRALQACLM